MVRLGIVGIGNMGSAHVEWVPKIKGLELRAICDLDPAKLDRYPDIPHYAESAAMIRSGSIDAILIATPHYFHTTIGIDAFENGLHVLSEKPISVHKADAQRLIDAYRKHGEPKGKIFCAMFNQRTDPHFQAIRRVVRNGELGKIQRTNWIITNWFRTDTYYASGGWRATWAGEGGGVLLNQCPHNLDLFQWICGMPSKVRANCNFGKYHNIEVEDEVTATFEYPDGSTGVFITSTGEAPGTNRLEIVGDRGKLVYEDGRILFTRTESSVEEINRTSPDSFAPVPTWNCEIPVNGYGGQHQEILRNFADAILDGKDLVAPAIEGIHSVELANAMILSTLLDEEVDVPLDAALYESKLQDLVKNSRFQKTVAEAKEVDMSASFGR
jgi:predicted dehydrogenase